MKEYIKGIVSSNSSGKYLEFNSSFGIVVSFKTTAILDAISQNDKLYNAYQKLGLCVLIGLNIEETTTREVILHSDKTVEEHLKSVYKAEKQRAKEQIEKAKEMIKESLRIEKEIDKLIGNE